MELKFNIKAKWLELNPGSNRTFMELKFNIKAKWLELNPF